MDGQMTRRERNNFRRRQKLLASARALFDAQGFEQTTMIQMAKSAGVALRTVYNFFPTKLDVLGELLLTEAEARMTAASAAQGPLPASPHASLLRLLEMQVEVVTTFSREEGRLFSAHAISVGGSTPAGRSYGLVDKMFHLEILKLLQKAFGKRGTLPRGINIEAMARLVFNAINGAYFQWLSDDTMTKNQFLALIREHVNILLPAPPKSKVNARTASRTATKRG